jgi:hypothetical protein
VSERLPIWPMSAHCPMSPEWAPPSTARLGLVACLLSFQKVVNALEQGSVAVEGEFRRLVHYVDDLVDGRRAIRDDWGGWSTSARLRLLRVLPRALRGWLCPHQGCVLVDCSHAVPVVGVHRRA